MRLRKLDPELRSRIRRIATKLVGPTDFELMDNGLLTLIDRDAHMQCRFEAGHLHWWPASECPSPGFLHKAEAMEAFYRRHRIVGFEPREVLYQ